MADLINPEDGKVKLPDVQVHDPKNDTTPTSQLISPWGVPPPESTSLYPG
jgi:hypothetical protein